LARRKPPNADLEEGTLFAQSRRIEWAVMMKRSFGFDTANAGHENLLRLVLRRRVLRRD
jgi:hypothetical protein